MYCAASSAHFYSYIECIAGTFSTRYQAKAIVIVGISKTKAELIIVINKIKIKPDVAHFLFFDYIFDKKSRIDF